MIDMKLEGTLVGPMQMPGEPDILIGMDVGGHRIAMSQEAAYIFAQQIDSILTILGFFEFEDEEECEEHLDPRLH